MKIYEVLDPRNGALYNVDMLTEVRRNDRARFDIIEQNMVCPICMKKSIDLVVAIGMPSFFKNNNEAHGLTCDYYGTKLGEKELISLQKSNAQILMQHTQRAIDILNKLTPKMDDDFIYLESKLLDKKLNKFDYNTPKLFYGLCNVKYLGENEFGIHNFALTTRESNEIIHLGIGKKCSEIMSEEQLSLLQNNRRVKIAMIGSIKRKGRFNNLSITKTKSIQLEEQR